MILLTTGNGKGKTTAALGQTIRVIGQGGKVAFLQFIKSEKWRTGEDNAFKKCSGCILHIKGGKGFIGIQGDTLPRSEHKKAAEQLLNKAKNLINSKKYQLVVLDEINTALSLRLIKTKDVIRIITSAPPATDIMLTGRGAPKTLIKTADIVTECKNIKHSYQHGIQGAKTREY